MSGGEGIEATRHQGTGPEAMIYHIHVVVERAHDLHNLGQWCMSTPEPELRCNRQLALAKALVLRLAKHLQGGRPATEAELQAAVLGEPLPPMEDHRACRVAEPTSEPLPSSALLESGDGRETLNQEER